MPRLSAVGISGLQPGEDVNFRTGKDRCTASPHYTPNDPQLLMVLV